MGENLALAPLPQRTLELAEYILCSARRSVQSPTAGRSLLSNSTYRRKCSNSQVMIRPIKALQALAEEIGHRIGPQLAQMKAAAGSRR